MAIFTPHAVISPAIVEKNKGAGLAGLDYLDSRGLVDLVNEVHSGTKRGKHKRHSAPVADRSSEVTDPSHSYSTPEFVRPLRVTP